MTKASTKLKRTFQPPQESAIGSRAVASHRQPCELCSNFLSILKNNNRQFNDLQLTFYRVVYSKRETYMQQID